MRQTTIRGNDCLPNVFPLQKGFIDKAWHRPFLDPGDVDNNYTKTTIGGATDGDVTISATGHVGGSLRFANNSTDDDSGALLRGLATVKAASREVTLAQSYGVGGVSDATECDLWLGWGVADTDAVGGITDFVGFRKVDGSTAVQAVLIRNGSDVVAATVYTLVAATPVALSIHVQVKEDGTGVTSWFVNGRCVKTYVSTIHPLSEEFFAGLIQWQTGAGAAQTFDLCLDEGCFSFELVSSAS